MENIDLLLFDFDGTLVDTSQGIVNAVNYSLQKMNIAPRPGDTIIAHVGHGLRYLLEKVSMVDHPEQLDNAVRWYHEYYKARAYQESFVYAHVIEMLTFFSNKKKVIVSNKTCESATHLLKVLKIDNYFDAIMGGDDPACRKPNACPIDKMRARYGVSHDRAMMIGDMPVDIIAGKNAGILTCGVCYGFGKKDDLTNVYPDYLIDDIIELKDIIR
ncbi:MAG: HAD-IA family hydrolase [Candidatus Omnitrophica bacterium]|nr:HAD-IA family hydrolase [Candidatus Omnitrophota bacterium]